MKIGNKIYDGTVEPIMVILDEQDKKNLKDMSKEATKYCCYPLESFQGIRNWMEE